MNLSEAMMSIKSSLDLGGWLHQAEAKLLHHAELVVVFPHFTNLPSSSLGEQHLGHLNTLLRRQDALELLSVCTLERQPHGCKVSLFDNLVYGEFQVRKRLYPSELDLSALFGEHQVRVVGEMKQTIWSDQFLQYAKAALVPEFVVQPLEKLRHSG